MTVGDNNPASRTGISVREALDGMDGMLFESDDTGPSHSFTVRKDNDMVVLELTINTAYQGMLDDETLDAVTRQLDEASTHSGIMIAVNNKSALKIHYLIDLSSYLDSSFQTMLEDLEGVRESFTDVITSKDFKIHQLI